MTPIFQKQLEAKQRRRQQIISLPIEEKLVIMEKLRDQAILLRESRKRLARNSKLFTKFSMSEKHVLSTEHAEHVRHLIGDSIFAIETSLPGLTRCVEKGESAEALVLIKAFQGCLETAKQRLHDLDAQANSVKFEEFKPDEESGIGLMPMEEFVNNVKSNAITDDDGTGFFATTSLYDQSQMMESNRRVVPSEIAGGKPIPDWATHVAWYAK